jgi:PAS domain-containing protein
VNVTDTKVQVLGWRVEAVVMKEPKIKFIHDFENYFFQFWGWRVLTRAVDFDGETRIRRSVGSFLFFC